MSPPNSPSRGRASATVAGTDPIIVFGYPRVIYVRHVYFFFEELAGYRRMWYAEPVNIAVIVEILPVYIVIVCSFDCRPSDPSLFLSLYVSVLYLRRPCRSFVDKLSFTRIRASITVAGNNPVVVPPFC